MVETNAHASDTWQIEPVWFVMVWWSNQFINGFPNWDATKV